jgi:mRNA interferase MazF
MTNYKQGDIVFIDFPFDDATAAKPRPAIIVGNAPSKFNSYIFAKITSNPDSDKHSFWLSATDLSVNMRVVSQVRTNDIHTIHQRFILKKLSTLNQDVLISLCDLIKTNFDILP